jgi:hypothetical protein
MAAVIYIEMLDAGCLEEALNPASGIQHLLLRSLHVALRHPETMKISFQFSVFSFRPSVKNELKTEN